MLQKILIFQQLVWAFYIIILIVRQNYFSDPTKILDLLAKPFFPCIMLRESASCCWKIAIYFEFVCFRFRNDIVNKKHYFARWHKQDRRLVCGRAIECSVHRLKFAARSNVREHQRAYNPWKVSHHSYISISCPRGIMIYDAKWLSLAKRIKKLFIMLAGKIQSLSANLCIKNLCHPVLYCFILVSSFCCKIA